jgi:hypothetical protein
MPGGSVQFTAILTGTCNSPDFEWSGNLENGDVDFDGLFTAFEEVSGGGGQRVFRLKYNAQSTAGLPETGQVCVVDYANNDISYCASVTIKAKVAAIPTLNEWVMIILGLLIFAVGTINIVRRRRAAMAR